MHSKIDISLCYPSRNTCIVPLNFHMPALTPLFSFNTQESITVSYSILIRNIIESNEYKLKSQLGECYWHLMGYGRCQAYNNAQEILQNKELSTYFNTEIVGGWETLGYIIMGFVTSVWNLTLSSLHDIIYWILPEVKDYVWLTQFCILQNSFPQGWLRVSSTS